MHTELWDEAPPMRRSWRERAALRLEALARRLYRWVEERQERGMQGKARDELTRAIDLANARFRAWYQHGLRVAGIWGFVDTTIPNFFVMCLECGRRRTQLCEWLDPVTASNLPGLTRGIIRVVVDQGCEHLAPLLADEDPPEVVELTKLELLAGE